MPKLAHRDNNNSSVERNEDENWIEENWIIKLLIWQEMIQLGKFSLTKKI